MEYDRVYSIRKGEYLADALKRAGKDFIPTNCIINKLLPGLGATYCELTAPRKSIIIEPNVPVIESKAKQHKNALAVYKGVSIRQVADFLEANREKNYKLLTTPEGFNKIKEAMQTVDIDMYTECFILFDECEKLVQDVHYRDSIREPMNDFFRFQMKALISATPIVPEKDSRFDGFIRVLIQPDYAYRQKLKLITTNNVLETLQEVIEAKRGTVCIFCNSIDSIDSFYRLIPELSNACTFCSEDGQYKLWKGNRRKKSMMITELERYNFFTSRFYSAVDILCKNPPHVIFVSDLYGAAQSVIDPATEAIQIIGRFRGGVNSVTHIASIRPELECMSSSEIDHWIQGASAIFNDWKAQLARTTNIGERTLLQEAIGENSYLPYLDENGKPDSFLIANFYEKEQVKRLYTSADLLCSAYEQTGYFVFSHEERLMPVSDNERMAIQHRLAKKKRAELIVRKLEEMEKMSRATDKKIQKRYQRMLVNLITSTADKYIYDCFCRFGAEFIRETDYNENKLRTALNVSSEHTIKKSGQMRIYIQRTFPVGAEFSVQEAKSMLKQVYKKMGLNTGRGITTKELEQYAEVENSRNHEARMIKILKHK